MCSCTNSFNRIQKPEFVLGTPSRIVIVSYHFLSRFLIYAFFNGRQNKRRIRGVPDVDIKYLSFVPLSRRLNTVHATSPAEIVARTIPTMISNPFMASLDPLACGSIPSGVRSRRGKNTSKSIRNDGRRRTRSVRPHQYCSPRGGPSQMDMVYESVTWVRR